jgi:hypothetical protein
LLLFAVVFGCAGELKSARTLSREKVYFLCARRLGFYDTNMTITRDEMGYLIENVKRCHRPAARQSAQEEMA